MYNDTFFDSPPTLQGQERAQLEQLYRYLNTMSDKLNQALMAISIDQLTPETQKMIRTAETSAAGTSETLKAMIVKTAQIVRNEMDEISTQLEGHYQALSDEFGEYQRDLVTTITATAEGVLQNFNIDERITNAQESADNYRKQISKYIYSGILPSGESGIAIGENVTNEDGSLSSENKMATFTMQELAFWHGDVKYAYFSDMVMHISKAEITNSMRMGLHTWIVLSNNDIGLLSGKQAAAEE